jgi:hypothetical protein
MDAAPVWALRMLDELPGCRVACDVDEVAGLVTAFRRSSTPVRFDLDDVDSLVPDLVVLASISYALEVAGMHPHADQGMHVTVSVGSATASGTLTASPTSEGD